MDGDIPEGYAPLFGRRYDLFQAKYPPQEFAVVVDHEQLGIELIRLMSKVDPAAASAMIQQRWDSQAITFRARLIDLSTKSVVLTASAVRSIWQFKDWEIGETAARQRLVAAAGFDGGLMARDEAGDWKGQDWEPEAGASQEVAGHEPEDENQDSDPGTEFSSEESLAAPQGNDGNTESLERVVDSGRNGKAIKIAPKSMINQIKNQAKKKGIHVGNLSDQMPLEEARESLKKLMQA